MQNILLNNGQNVIIGSNRDILEVIEEKLSYELAKYIEQILWNQEEIDKYIRDIEKSNSNLLDEKEKLENTIQEYSNKTLQDNEYFDFLINRKTEI